MNDVIEHRSAQRTVFLESSLQRKRQRNRLASEVAQRERAEAELQRTRERFRILSAQFERIREDERKRMAMEMHDELGQLLTALKISVSLNVGQLSGLPEAMKQAIEARELVERAMLAMRSMVNRIRPAALSFGLTAALEWLAEDIRRGTTSSCNLHVVGREICLTDEQATVIFRVAQEALTNAVRHADASSVWILLTYHETYTELTVSDNGRGFERKKKDDHGSYGLLGMAERARLINADLEIDSRPGEGCAVRLRHNI
ncbi:sensor histidine kinase [Paraburkholderia sp. JHI869]|uniref:sensor histidine kinase n=1 Tax=Paraburkholderia sp. JHI869 TaxID=3112959 RepID=UPI0031784C85